MRVTLFVNVILPLAVPNTYTYRVPFELNDEIAVGKRVLVSFGGSKIYAAVVAEIHQIPPKNYQAKYLEALIDEYAVVTEKQLELWFWISKYYLAHIGEVMLAAMPAALRLASETKVLAKEIGIEKQEQLSSIEVEVYELLCQREIMTLAEIADGLSRKTIYPIVKSMLEKGVVEVEEEVHDRYKPLYKAFVRIHPQWQNEQAISKAFDELSRAPKQQDALMKILQVADGQLSRWMLRKNLESKDLNATHFNGLEGKGIIEIEKFPVDRIPGSESSGDKVNLSKDQLEAYKGIKSGFSEKKVTLLHGITGSGKTEIYIKLIEEALAEDCQVLYLVPEIALTSQLTTRLEAYFGKLLGVYHSKFSNNERAEVWYKLLDQGKVKVIIGARSSLMMPFSNLGLVIVDEEHESSFKQHHPAPRYQGRDAAIMLGHLHNASVLLGSATPSVESFANAHNGKYHYVPLLKRFGKAKLPQVYVSDLKVAKKEQTMDGEFSHFLIDAIKETLANKEQVILFQNRRGFSPRWMCNTCGWVPECNNCDISLTYHKYQHRLRCHYCGYKIQAPKTCMACGSHELSMLGFGTEKIEDDLQELLPNAKISRMDFDTTRGKNAYQKIIHDFQDKQIDILVGTQMVTKGLDFRDVGLVGVLSADQLLSFPDFRSSERAYQLMTQVSGRAGRTEKQGKVIIQAFNANHYVINQVVQGEMQKVYEMELQERKGFMYPPFCRLIALVFRHRDKYVVDEASKHFLNRLRIKLGGRVLGPEAPAVARVKNQYIMQGLIKLEHKLNANSVKDFLREEIIDLKTHKSFKSVRIICDVDPN